MSAESIPTPSNSSKWGWGVLLVLSILLVLNGVALFIMSSSPTMFEQDTGVSYEVVAGEFPTVAQQVVNQERVISTMLAVVGLMASVAAWTGFRRGERWAWTITGILVVMLVVFAVVFLGVAGRVDIGGFYLVLALIALVGQVLAGRRMPE